MNARTALGFAGFFSLLLIARPALAVDGVIEINQSRALAGNVSPTDGPGYPIILTVSGSYRVTSDLAAPVNSDGIRIDADNVTLDLNGFTLYGGGGLIADGVQIANHSNIEIKNGTIRGFTRHGIFTNINTHFIRVINVRAIGNAIFGVDLQGGGNLIDGCTAINNVVGLSASDGSLVVNSVARSNSSFGMSLGLNAGYRSCVLTGNNGGNANAQVSNGIQLGSNICGTDTVCP